MKRSVNADESAAVDTQRQADAADAQLRASMRPLLVEVKPFAAPPPDMGGHYDEATKHHRYKLEFPDDFKADEWDGRKPFVYSHIGEPLRVSVIIRNVGNGLALISSGDIDIVNEPGLEAVHRQVRYPRLPPGESTRVNLVFRAGRNSHEAPLTISLPYTDLSGVHREVALVRLEYQRTRARIRDQTGHAWYVANIEHETW